MNFRYRLMQLMQGRYGLDEMFFVLFGISSILAVLNIFLRLWVIQIIVYLISFYAIFRFMSRNIYARRRENDFVTGGIAAYSKRYKTYMTRKADKTHIYKKCPNCKAVLRLPRRKGKHETVCPGCRVRFTVRVYKD